MKYVIMLLLLAGIAYADVPPVNFYGFVYSGDSPAADGLLVSVEGDCLSGQIAQAQTGYGRGYYDLNVRMDDQTTTDDEGCIPDEIVVFRINGNSQQVRLPQSGSVMNINFIMQEDNTIRTGSRGGGGSGGSSSGGSYPIIEPQKQEALPVPPINYYGFVYIDSTLAADGTIMTVLGDCYGTGSAGLAQATTGFGKGYYDVEIPMDNPSTAEDEGCTAGQTVYFGIEGFEPEEITLATPGQSMHHDLHYSTDQSESAGEAGELQAPINVRLGLFRQQGFGNKLAFALLICLATLALIIALRDRKR